MLTAAQKKLLAKVLGGDELYGTRIYPNEWKWRRPLIVGEEWVEEGLVVGLIRDGAGWIKESREGNTDFRRFVVNSVRALALLAEPKPPAVDPLQTDRIPEDHPAKQPVAKKGR